MENCFSGEKMGAISFPARVCDVKGDDSLSGSQDERHDGVVLVIVGRVGRHSGAGDDSRRRVEQRGEGDADFF